MNLHAKEWDTLLYALVDGPIEVSKTISLLKGVMDQARKKGVTKVLIDGRMVTGNMIKADRIRAAHVVAEHAEMLRTKVWIAFVGGFPTFNGLGVRRARVLGFKIDLFSDVTEALRWLNTNRSASES